MLQGTWDFDKSLHGLGGKKEMLFVSPLRVTNNLTKLYMFFERIYWLVALIYVDCIIIEHACSQAYSLRNQNPD